MIEDKSLLGGVAAAVLVAALGGFSVARCTSTPASTSQTADAKGSKAEKPAAPADTVVMTAQAIKEAGIRTETIAQGGLGSEIVAQA